MSKKIIKREHIGPLLSGIDNVEIYNNQGKYYYLTFYNQSSKSGKVKFFDNKGDILFVKSLSPGQNKIRIEKQNYIKILSKENVFLTAIKAEGARIMNWPWNKSFKIKINSKDTNNLTPIDQDDNMLNFSTDFLIDETLHKIEQKFYDGELEKDFSSYSNYFLKDILKKDYFLKSDKSGFLIFKKKQNITN